MKNQQNAIDERYDESLKRLANMLWKKEFERRKWANERWSDPQGMRFKLCRIFIPLLSVYTVMSLLIYCMIRDSQYMMSKLYDDMMGLSYDADVSNIELIIGIVAVLCVTLVAANIVLICKKYKVGAYMTLATELVAAVHLLTQINIGMPEDNNKYVVFCILNCVVYLVEAMLAFYLLYALGSKRRYTKRAVYHVLTGFINNSENMLEKSDYCELIDEYIKKHDGNEENDKEDSAEAIFSDDE